MKKSLLITAIILLTACGPNEADFKSTVPPLNERVAPQSTHAPKELPHDSSTIVVPQSEMNMNVTFYPQAPDADWGMPWQEACEEASAVLAYYYVTGQPLSKPLFKSEVNGLVDWQNREFGDFKHSTIDQTAQMINGYFKFSDFQVLENPTIEDLKKELANMNLIIAPFAGRQLGNPFYTGEGPLYHMMVIKGYDEKHFITNDVGTRRGQDFIYPYKTIMDAMHDWHDTDMNLGAKKVIVMR